MHHHKMSLLVTALLLASATCHPVQNGESKNSVNQVKATRVKAAATTPEVANEAVNQVPEVAEFPDRRGFVTGHRIPLELFGADTLRRIELLEDEDTSNNEESGQRHLSAYVDSDDIRSPVALPSSSATAAELFSADVTVRRPASFPGFHRRPAEYLLGGGLSRESDVKYRDSLTSIVPLDFMDYY